MYYVTTPITRTTARSRQDRLHRALTPGADVLLPWSEHAAVGRAAHLIAMDTCMLLLREATVGAGRNVGAWR